MFSAVGGTVTLSVIHEPVSGDIQYEPVTTLAASTT